MKPTDRLDEIRQRWEGHGGKEFVAWRNMNETGWCVGNKEDRSGAVQSYATADTEDTAVRIGFAPSDISWLLARVRELEVENERLWRTMADVDGTAEADRFGGANLMADPYRVPSTDSEAKQ